MSSINVPPAAAITTFVRLSMSVVTPLASTPNTSINCATVVVANVVVNAFQATPASASAVNVRPVERWGVNTSVAAARSARNVGICPTIDFAVSLPTSAPAQIRF